MIIVRAPFRVSFLGGGSDIPKFYREFRGATLATAIDKHVFMTGRRMFDAKKTLLKYSRVETVSSIDEIQHPIFRVALDLYAESGLDIGVTADIPAGTGLGSSSAFTVCLIGLLEETQGRRIDKTKLAELACKIELDLLGEPIGKQDQYASSFGGVNLFLFNQDETVEIKPLTLSPSDLDWLNSNMLLVQIPLESRSASQILSRMKEHIDENPHARKALRDLADLAVNGYEHIQSSGIEVLPELLRESWELKKISNPHAVISLGEKMINRGLDLGAKAAKVLGAGGSGFVLFIADSQVQEILESEFSNTKALRVRIDLEGATTIYRGGKD